MGKGDSKIKAEPHVGHLDYTNMPVSFKIRKVLRYIKLYGVARTYTKVKAQIHMKSEEDFPGTIWSNGKYKPVASTSQEVAIIGCGAFAFGNIAYYLNKNFKGSVRAAMDSSGARARSLVNKYNGKYACKDASEIMQDGRVKLVYVASNHASHAPYAVQALDAGKDVHIEKPHVVTEDQLKLLVKAMKRNEDRNVYLGFNRPKSKLFEKLKDALAVEQGPVMVNWFVAGHEIHDEHWYFKESEGGRILGNLCHWTDLTLEMVGLENAFPARITPTSVSNAKSDFVTGIEFADGSLAAITFSAKGHTFEGVSEVLKLHRGDLLAEIEDFQTLTLKCGPKTVRERPWHRDHGHEANILNSYIASKQGTKSMAVTIEHVVASAKLFLAVRDAHRDRSQVEISKEQLFEYVSEFGSAQFQSKPA